MIDQLKQEERTTVRGMTEHGMGHGVGQEVLPDFGPFSSRSHMYFAE